MDGKFLNQRNLKNSNKENTIFVPQVIAWKKEYVNECTSARVQTERIDSELQIQVSQIF